LALILNIDTATEKASVGLSLDGVQLAMVENGNQREHAAFVHSAVEQVLDAACRKLAAVDAFAVTSGPGSYTGIRVGLATAKGFCYALSRPLITLNTLQVMTLAAIETVGNQGHDTLFCPMIDARRNEVFVAIYDAELHEVLVPQHLVLEHRIFVSFARGRRIIFFGSGSEKFEQMGEQPEGRFEKVEYNTRHLGVLAEQLFKSKRFSDISYSEPSYLKDFYTVVKN